MTYRIVSLDGGGIRGLTTTVLLERIVGLQPRMLSQVNLFAGTSIGGVLALGLAAGAAPTQMRQLFLERGPALLLDAARPPDVTAQAHYDNYNLKRFMLELFGDMTLGDLPGKVVVVAFNLDTGVTNPDRLRRATAKVFHNFPGPTGDHDTLAVDVAMATSAYPVFFPIYKGHIDGGVAAVNPSMCALAAALDERTGRQRLEDVALLSISTGHGPNPIPVEDGGDWGWKQWSVDYRIVSATMSADGPLVHYQCRQLLGDRYYRLDPEFDQPIRFNDVFSIPKLLRTAMQIDLSEAGTWLARYFA